MRKLLISLIIIVAGAVSASACEFSYSTNKDLYSIGDIVSLKVVIENDHRRCPHEGEQPVVMVKNITAVSKSELVEITPGKWVIEYKFKITGSSPAVKLSRNCNKGGFDEVIYFKIK